MPVRHLGGNLSATAGSVSSSLSGCAHDVVQARDITGGVHFHVPPGSQSAPVPRQLPAEVAGFVGRSEELDRLETLTTGGPGAGGRLVVLAGTAGAGKTSLAVRFAHRIARRFPDGQLFVNLRGYDPEPPLPPAAALERFLRSLGAPAAAIPGEMEERSQLYRSLLAARRVLIVLDNAATAGQVRPLLPGEAGCLVVVTSRSRLSGLAARDGAQRITLGLLSEQEAVDLITEVTASYRTGDEPGHIAQLGRLCACLPLALRIAAERAAARPLMPLPELITQLCAESSLWDTLSSQEEGEADAVRSVFAWSYRALPPAAARAFRLLGLHPGAHFSAGAAAAVTGEPIPRISGLLDVLAGAHLLEQIAPDRYQFHDLLRAYAADQAHRLDSHEQQRAALARAARWYLHAADSAARTVQRLFPSLLDEPPTAGTEPPVFDDYTAAMAWFQRERANLLAIERAAAAAGLDKVAWQLPATLHPLLNAHGAVDDWLEMSRLALGAAGRLGDERAEAITSQTAGVAARAAGDLPLAAGHHAAALRLYTILGDSTGMLEAGSSLGLVHLDRRELDPAIEHFERALEHAADPSRHQWRALLLEDLAFAHAQAGRLQLAGDLAAQSADLCVRAGVDPQLRIDPLLTLALVYRESGRFEQAGQYLDAAAAILDDGVVYRSVELAVRREQAALALAQGEARHALDIAWQCALTARRLGDHRREALTLDEIGQALLALGRAEEAADFFGTAAALARTHAGPADTAAILAHLADALERSGEAQPADAARVEALALLAGIADPRAAALREHLHALSRPA